MKVYVVLYHDDGNPPLSTAQVFAEVTEALDWAEKVDGIVIIRNIVTTRR
jgi:hypothetical protein